MADLAAFDNYFQTQLETEPQTAYMGAMSQRFGNETNPFFSGAKNYFSSGNQFSDMYNRYLGVKGTELMNRSKSLEQGKPASDKPLTSFMDYLENDPFTQRYAAMTPRQRGTSTSRFAPSTRYILY